MDNSKFQCSWKIHISIMILSCFALLSVMLSQNVAATVPLVEIMLSGTTNNQNCENKCVVSQTVTVQKGSAVEWINNDLVPHTLVSGNLGDKDNGTLFDSGQIWVGKFFIHNFNDVGIYHYFERDHPENNGMINVTDVTYPNALSEITPLQTHDNNDDNLTIHDEAGVDVTGKILPAPVLYSSESSVAVTSPLKQFKSGIVANDVKCGHGLQLVIKAEDNSPACVKPQTAQKLVERGWGWAMQPMDSLKPLLPNRITGLENDAGTVTFGNRTYYFETPHYTQDAYVNLMQISFHDVIFTLFPSGFKGGLPDNDCGSQYYWTDAKFSDGTSELLHIFPITSTSQQCLALPEPAYFSNHTNLQAGLTFYDGKMKLLVSTSTINSNGN